jgi:hypothetical protein
MAAGLRATSFFDYNGKRIGVQGSVDRPVDGMRMERREGSKKIG